MTNFHLLSILIATTLLLQVVLAIDYQVIDKVPQTPGGMKFEKVVGVDFTKQTMGTINQFIYDTFDQQDNPDDRRPQDTVIVIIDQYDDPSAAAITIGNTINVSAVYIQEYDMDMRWEFTSLLYHEMTHVFQWIPSNAPQGLIEGIADYMMIRANYYPPVLAHPGDGDRWDQGYGITARFLEYCESLLGGFVAQLNKKMKDSYADEYFIDILDKPVDVLWKEYKKKYSHNV
ncbi:hypothetical protein DCAR_0100720 [Daucus carota subsp. sativus]|uniref:Uncharacterized protein n=1 Tax=Daucus carota subsp. sativus TaxID=79200 RepID=A0A166FVG4_DAUCS|nr:PREDICTED: uncharacterized protein LOC108208499 [Daucus carota subsp. sativus]WOG81569.1 hypothetical protein DCAR_0100720 [Daucus carota subsp. sativus]